MRRAEPHGLMLLDTAVAVLPRLLRRPGQLERPDGTPVNAVRGLLDFIARLVERLPADRTWSAAGTTTGDRSGAWTCCRRTRRTGWSRERRRGGPDVEEVPDAAARSRSRSSVDVLDALGIAVVGADGYEADDVIGTLATDAGSRSTSSPATGDLFQLVDDAAGQRGSTPRRGVGRHERDAIDCGRRGKYAVLAAPVRRLRHPARRRLRRPARRGRRR